MSVVPATPIKIGELSARSQVSIKTIRYYEEIGLLPQPDRTEVLAQFVCVAQW